MARPIWMSLRWVRVQRRRRLDQSSIPMELKELPEDPHEDQRLRLRETFVYEPLEQIQDEVSDNLPHSVVS